MTEDYFMEEYLRNALSDSIRSSNSTDNVERKERRLSSSYYKDLKEKLLIKYENKSLDDVMDCKIKNTSCGDQLAKACRAALNAQN